MKVSIKEKVISKIYFGLCKYLHTDNMLDVFKDECYGDTSPKKEKINLSLNSVLDPICVSQYKNLFFSLIFSFK
jgi:hypothetical protein